MRGSYLPLLILLTGIFVYRSNAVAQAPVLHVIAGPGVVLTREEVKEVFLGDKTFSASTKLIPLDNLSVRDGFLGKVLNLTAAKYESIWTKKAFRDGLNPPKALENDNAVIEYVRRTAGAVGYVTTAPAGVTVVSKY